MEANEESRPDMRRDPGATRPAGIEWVVVATSDLNGRLRGKALSAMEFDDAIQTGATAITDLVLATDAADVPIPTSVGVGPVASARDLMLQPDPGTLALLPSRPGWAWCLATPAWSDGSPCGLAPRAVCSSVLAELAGRGYHARAAFEYEFRLYDLATNTAITPTASYSLHHLRGVAGFLADLKAATHACGIEILALHTEAAPGLLEVSVAPARGLRAADQAMLLRACIEDAAGLRDMRASFLAKPASGEEGSGGHLHLSFEDDDARNVFAEDRSEASSFSDQLLYAVAGLLRHMGSLSVLYNPNINSYKRLVPGWFAPVSADWAVDDRTVAVRIVRGRESRATHLEVRRAGADANPYLVLAAAVCSIASGFDVQEPPIPPAASSESLPGDLGSALGAFRGDLDMRRRLGEDFCAHFEATREWELEAWREVVTEWEIARVEGASRSVGRGGR